MKMNKKYYIVIVAIVLILIYLGFMVFAGEEGYRLICDNANDMKEYTACIRLDTLINR